MWQLTFQQWVLIGLGGVVALFLSMARFRFAVLTVGAMIMCSALSPLNDWQGRLVTTWLTPVQLQRTPIFAVAGLMLLATAVFHMPRIRMNRVAGPVICLLLIALYAGLVRIIASSDPASGVIAIVFAFVTIFPAMIVIPAMIDDSEDCYRLLRIVGFVTAAWIAAVAVQFVLRRQVLNLGGGGTRFNGMLGNPQHAGCYLAVGTVVCLFLALNDTVIRYKALWVALTAVNAVLLLWTFSRTGLGMAVIGASAVLYARLGRAVLAAPVVGAIGLAALKIVQGAGVDLSMQQFNERGDTRSRAWSVLAQQFLSNPAFGTGSTEETVSSENSLLYGLATYGVGMGVLLVAFGIVSGIFVLRLVRARPSLEPVERRLGDLVVGFMAMYFAGACFEGYLLSRVSTSLAFFLVITPIGMRLLQFAEARRQHDTPSADPSDSWSPDAEYADLSDSYGRDAPEDLSDSSGRSVA